MAWAAAVANTPASNKVSGFSGEVMDTSNAAVLPKTQLGSNSVTKKNSDNTKQINTKFVAFSNVNGY